MGRGAEYLRDLAPRQETTRETALGLELRDLPSWVETATLLRAMKPVEIYHATPELRFTESDQTDPAGRYRLQGSGQGFKLQRALTAAWATAQDILSVDPNTNFTVHLLGGATTMQLLLSAADVQARGASIQLRANNYGAGDNMGSLMSPDATYGSSISRLTWTGHVAQGSGKIYVYEPLVAETGILKLRAESAVGSVDLETSGPVTVARAVPTATTATPFLAVTGNITTPLVGTLPSNWWAIAYVLGGAATLWVNDNGVIKSLSLGTPA